MYEWGDGTYSFTPDPKFDDHVPIPVEKLGWMFTYFVTIIMVPLLFVPVLTSTFTTSFGKSDPFSKKDQEKNLAYFGLLLAGVVRWSGMFLILYTWMNVLGKTDVSDTVQVAQNMKSAWPWLWSMLDMATNQDWVLTYAAPFGKVGL